MACLIFLVLDIFVRHDSHNNFVDYELFLHHYFPLVGEVYQFFDNQVAFSIEGYVGLN